MEVVGLVASVMGILTFLGTCVELFAKLRQKLHRAPEIIRLLLQDLKNAEPMLKQAGKTLNRFPYHSFPDDNATLSICELYVRKMSLMAKEAERYRKLHLEFPEDMIPELEERRQTLGLGLDRLKQHLGLLERQVCSRYPTPYRHELMLTGIAVATRNP